MDRHQPWNVGAARLNIHHHHVEAGRFAHHLERTPDVSAADDEELRRGQKGLQEDAHLPAAQCPDGVLARFGECIMRQARLAISQDLFRIRRPFQRWFRLPAKRDACPP